MVSGNTYSLLTWLYTQNVEPGYAFVYFRITVNSRRANISLNKKIITSLWDNQKSKVRGNSSESRILNQYLKEQEAKISNAYRLLEYEEKLVTAQLIKARYLGLDSVHQSFKDLFDYHNKVTEKKVAKATFGLYNVTQKYVFNFIKSEHKAEDIYLLHVNHKFITGFENYLGNYVPTNGRLGICNNTAMKHMQRLKKMLKMA